MTGYQNLLGSEKIFLCFPVRGHDADDRWLFLPRQEIKIQYRLDDRRIAAQRKDRAFPFPYLGEHAHRASSTAFVMTASDPYTAPRSLSFFKNSRMRVSPASSFGPPRRTYTFTPAARSFEADSLSISMIPRNVCLTSVKLATPPAMTSILLFEADASMRPMTSLAYRYVSSRVGPP